MVNSDLIAQNVLNTRDKVVEVNKLAVNQTRMTHEQYTHIGALSLSLSLRIWKKIITTISLQQLNLILSFSLSLCIQQ